MDQVVASRLGDEAEGPWPLPAGWCWTRLGLVASVNPSTSFDEISEAAEIPFIPMAAVSEETGLIDSAARRSVRDVSKGYVRFMEGDVIFAKITPCMENGKVAPVIGLPGRYAAGSTEFHVFRPAAVDQRYLWYWLVGRGFRAKAKRNMSGSAGQLRVPVDYLRESDFPLAPLAEQRRIVARVDALFAEIAEGEAALAAAREGLDTFRRALLKAAVTGELTKDWRAANPVGESGHDLLARIAETRAGKAPVKGRGRRATAAPPLDTSALPLLPEGWAWGTLGEVAEIVGGATVDKKRKPADPVTVPYLRVANVQRGHVDLSEVKSITVEREAAAKLRLRPGDLLLNEGGDRDKIGRGWVWDGTIPEMIHQNHVFRARLHDGGLNPFFVSHYANEIGRRFFIDEGKQTTNLASISLSKISLLPIPIPPPAEAAEIIRRVSEALAAAADTQAMLDAEAADAARLKQSILKAAFEGRLVAQDPADEPAAAMLARFKADQPNAKVVRRRPRAKPE
ncbi:restriction endonuclease subunit S [Prosthecomicrobium hirschii]|uniref:restriction endonuclease subunit S n=1 Tax=Prosthecodimorpha hirschii TaxID=665126 RepID=UPI00222093C9|nr:restriction endonuclease subunit S [Prosthecomicrobium hirschii]MCW1843891.1 restriction endonuclease subunit S [Prosthecomicrobium hirschii]